MLDPLRRQRTVLDECAAIETVVCLLNTRFLFSTGYETLEFVAVFFWAIRKRVCQLITQPCQATLYRVICTINNAAREVMRQKWRVTTRGHQRPQASRPLILTH